jgi:cullin-4
MVKPATIAALEESDVTSSILGYLTSFETWEEKLKLICKLFLYLDRSYLLPHHSKRQILEYGVGLFIDCFLQEEYGKQLLKKHNQLICTYRQNENDQTRDLAERLSKLLLVLNTNNQLKLHLQLISQIVTHYNQLKLNWQNPKEYMSIALRKMSDEMTFWKECGYPNNFLRELLMKLKWSLIFVEFQSIIEQTLPFILSSEKELQTLFKFCQSTMAEYQFESMQLFIHSWGKFLQRIFDTTIADLRVQYQSGKGNILDSIVELYLKYKLMADTKFSKEEKFEFEFRNGFIKVLNQKTNNTFIIMLLSKYCDQFFKNKKPELSFTEFKERVAIIFKSIQNKDLFIIPYKKDLSKRLLLNRGVNENQEIELAKLFLNTIGENDESISLQHMFNDLKISRNQYDDLTESSLIEFSPFILEKRYWPDIPKIDPNADNELILSPILQECVKQFMTQFHELDSKNCNKVLDWTNYGLHQLVIAVTFDRGVKELIVNLYQAIIILLFEHQQTYTIDEFVTSSQMDERFIKRIINSLMRCKLVIQHEDKYEFNYGLQDKSTKLKVPFAKDISSKEAKTIEKLQTIELIERSRQEEFRSSIVKIMKEHRLMTMTELLNTAVKQLQVRGPVTVQD